MDDVKQRAIVLDFTQLGTKAVLCFMEVVFNGASAACLDAVAYA